VYRACSVGDRSDGNLSHSESCRGSCWNDPLLRCFRCGDQRAENRCEGMAKHCDTEVENGDLSRVWPCYRLDFWSCLFNSRAAYTRTSLAINLGSIQPIARQLGESVLSIWYNAAGVTLWPLAVASLADRLICEMKTRSEGLSRNEAYGIPQLVLKLRRSMLIQGASHCQDRTSLTLSLASNLHLISPNTASPIH
jgi:hypothetical protein